MVLNGVHNSNGQSSRITYDTYAPIDDTLSMLSCIKDDVGYIECLLRGLSNPIYGVELLFDATVKERCARISRSNERLFQGQLVTRLGDFLRFDDKRERLASLKDLLTPTAPPPQEPSMPVMGREAYYGIAGEFVRLILPHTESDPTALLIQFLTRFGVAIGRHPYAMVEATPHYTQLFSCIVGATARARKGTSGDHVDSIMATVDTSWTENNAISACGSGEGVIWAIRDKIVKKEPVREKGRVIDYQDVITDEGIID